MNNQPLIASLEDEIDEVHHSLLAATMDLTNPLGELVRAQISHSQPSIYGAIVLAISKQPSAVREDGDLHHKRILLASALEMLHVALNIHRLLVNAAVQEHAGSETALDRSFIGSTILAGDYCFSRAAQMAAQTEHPQVVATFSMALQSVSEELLREQFYSPIQDGAYDETRQLLKSGAQAAALLVGFSEKQQQQANDFSEMIADQWLTQREGKGDTKSESDDQLPSDWQALQDWLAQQTL